MGGIFNAIMEATGLRSKYNKISNATLGRTEKVAGLLSLGDQRFSHLSPRERLDQVRDIQKNAHELLVDPQDLLSFRNGCVQFLNMHGTRSEIDRLVHKTLDVASGVFVSHDEENAFCLELLSDMRYVEDYKQDFLSYTKKHAPEVYAEYERQERELPHRGPDAGIYKSAIDPESSLGALVNVPYIEQQKADLE